MDEILEMSRQINFNNLIYNFKGSSPSIRFTEFGGPMYTYNQLKTDYKTLEQVEEQKNNNKWELGQVTSGDPEKIRKSITYNKKCYNSL